MPPSIYIYNRHVNLESDGDSDLFATLLMFSLLGIPLPSFLSLPLPPFPFLGGNPFMKWQLMD